MSDLGTFWLEPMWKHEWKPNQKIFVFYSLSVDPRSENSATEVKLRDHLYITSAKRLGGWVQRCHFCIQNSFRDSSLNFDSCSISHILEHCILLIFLWAILKKNCSCSSALKVRKYNFSQNWMPKYFIIGNHSDCIPECKRESTICI